MLLALDACNATHGTPGVCNAGGGLGLWSSPALRGPAAAWEPVSPVIFSSNDTVLPSAYLAKEFTTIDFLGRLEGDPHPQGLGTRVLLYY